MQRQHGMSQSDPAPDVRVPLGMPHQELRRLAQHALAEDIGWGDVTTQALVGPHLTLNAAIVSRQPGVVAGMVVAAEVYAAVDERITWTPLLADGAQVTPGTALAQVAGPAAGILTAERVALNYMQRLSGTATLTSQFVAAVAGTSARIIDTRKTTPGLRALEKYAVRCGGGFNHRFGLSDGVLVKDNHIALLRQQGLTLREIVALARQRVGHALRVEVEVDSLDQIAAVLEGGADTILLDNMAPHQLRQAVALIAGRAITEASGGVTLSTVRAIAEAGVDLISVGALTHSAPSLDLGLDSL